MFSVKKASKTEALWSLFFKYDTIDQSDNSIKHIWHIVWFLRMIAQNAKDSKNCDQESLIYKLKQTDWTTHIRFTERNVWNATQEINPQNL